MAEIAYRDFDLYLERWEGRFRASVRESPAGAASTAFELPFSPVKLENFLLRLGRVRRGVRRMESAETQAAKELGGALFEAVFAGELRACLRSSLDEVARERRGLRIRLHVDDAELASLPWEYLYYASRSQFLALSVHTPLVRYLDLPEPIPALTIEPPLRVLVMISSPTDHPALDVEREWRVLNDAVGTLHPSRRVVCDRLDEATLHALQRRLRRRPYHVFHFIGHGGYDREHDEGLLLLEDEAHKGHPVSSRTIGMLLRDHRPLRVVVLNACEGARASLVDPFAGSAQTLVQQGLPAVIAMQFEIGDEVATTFAQEFYGALSDGYPVDAAVTESRKAICAAGHDVEWGTPVLYMRSPDGRIFDMVPRTNPTVTAPAPDPGGSRAAAGVAAALAPVPSAREGPAASDESAERAARTALAKAHVEWHLEHGLLEDAETALVDALCVFPDDAALTSLRARVDEARRARAGEGSGDPERRRLSETDTLEPRDAEPEREPVAALLERARHASAEARHVEALQLVAQAEARDAESIDPRILKRHILHAIGDQARVSTLHERLVAAPWMRVPFAAAAAVLVLGAVVAIGLVRWLSPWPAAIRPAASRPADPAVAAANVPVKAGTRASLAPDSAPTASSQGGAAAAGSAREFTRPARTGTARAATGATVTAGALAFDVPAGVEAWVNGRSLGRSPIKAVGVRAGSHEIVLRRDDLGELHRTMRVDPGATTLVAATESAIRDAHADARERAARRALGSGSRERALEIASAAAALNPAHAPLSALLRDLLAQAVSEAGDARKAAERAGRAARRSTLFREAEAEIDRAERDLAAGRLAEATRGYWSARAQFDQAAAGFARR